MDLRLKDLLNPRFEVRSFSQIPRRGWLFAVLLLAGFAFYPAFFEGLLGPSVLLRLSFGLGVVGLALVGPTRWQYQLVFLSIGLAGYLSGQATIWAWLLSLLAASWLIVLTYRIQQRFTPAPSLWLKAIKALIWLCSSMFISFCLVALSELETNFAEEEFFVALTAVSFSFAWLLLAGAFLSLQSFRQNSVPQPRISRGNSLFFGLITGLGLIVFSLIVISRYQASFYSPQAPPYPGISDQTPFVCGQAAPNDATPDGRQTFNEILSQVEANPAKLTPEYGMLALGTGDKKWAEQFRAAILADARAESLLGSTGSVKFGQYEAALRAYYLNQVRANFPELFSEAELNTLKTWFSQINKHTLSIGWVDFLYALAFSKWPEGPYENQENGAGLLAQLELAGLADPASSIDNRAYLGQNIRGWSTRFKNSDDTYLYQREWTSSALFQAEFGQTLQPANAPSEKFRDLSFEWSLLQAIPDGFTLTYNHPYRVNFAAYFYLAATLTGDPDYIWLADRTLTASHKGNDVALLFAQPSADKAINLSGKSPTVGSCLLYSHAGLPNQRGPLAPDKVVLREGWNPADAYLLLDLRFTGWHRYKATNAITLFYKKSPIIVENVGVASYNWLPQGRSILRDKRIPRENLNGLLITRPGLNAVITQLTGLGGFWSQDPPYYAQVKSFTALNELDVSRTSVEDWHGWQHQRNIFFFHQGPLIVTDQASGPGESAISWHLVGELISPKQADGSLLLNNGQTLTKVVFPVEAQTAVSANSEPSTIAWLPDQTIWNLIYRSPAAGQLNLTTLFLSDDWLEAKPEIETLYDPGSTKPRGSYITLENETQQLRLWQNQSALPLSKEGVTLDGYAFSVLQSKTTAEATLCAIDATQVKIERFQEPQEITIVQVGQQTEPKPVWSWQDGLLTLTLSPASSACFKVKD